MSSSHNQLFLYDAFSEEKLTQIEAQGLDVFFPDYIRGWSDVLDCRAEPYPSKSIHENCHFAQHVHKNYILVSASQIAKETLPSSD